MNKKECNESLERLVEERTQELVQKNKELEANLEQSLETAKLTALGELASALSHEMKQPLSVMLMSLELLTADAEEESFDLLAHRLEIMQKALDRSSTTIQRMGIFGRKMRSDTQNLRNLSELIDNAVAHEKEQLQNDMISLEMEFSDTPIMFRCNPTQLEQVFTQLISNARSAMKDTSEKRLNIKSFMNEDLACIDISDTGKGMPKELVQEIYAPFFTTKESDGTGLGLSISKGIIQNHGGSIYCDSIEAEGTTFHLRFPVE